MRGVEADKLSADFAEKREILKSICRGIGCSGTNLDCPGNPSCDILRKIIKEERNET
jgi:hypothetical protein